jgi:hypothetical protein
VFGQAASGSIPNRSFTATPEFLLASQVALCRLDGHVAEQELDLVEFAVRQVAKAGAGSSQIVRRQPFDVGARRRRADDVQTSGCSGRRSWRVRSRGAPEHASAPSSCERSTWASATASFAVADSFIERPSLRVSHG